MTAVSSRARLVAYLGEVRDILLADVRDLRRERRTLAEQVATTRARRDRLRQQVVIARACRDAIKKGKS